MRAISVATDRPKAQIILAHRFERLSTLVGASKSIGCTETDAVVVFCIRKRLLRGDLSLRAASDRRQSIRN